MPVYRQLGRVPRKRHVVFAREGGGLYYEELMGNQGFSGLSSLLYHERRPTAVRSSRLLAELSWEADPDRTLRMRHFRLGRLEAGGSPTLGRVPIAFNAEVALSVVQPGRSDEFFYRNAQGDELLFVADGEGVLESQLGELDYGRGDYLVVPRGILYRLRLGAGPHRLFVVESAGAVETPRRYRNEHGQLVEGAPYCERDLRAPERLVQHEAAGEARLVVKAQNRLTEVVLDHHPFDVVGWDGYYYPWALNVRDFEPIVGRIHQPPPVHQTFQGPGFVVCSFVPRPYDFDPRAVPAPYHHANVRSDEVIFYAKDRFMSRKGIEYASLTLHPDGLVHGPHPGRTEESIGQKETDELAVMVDTFQPLTVARDVLAVEDADYGRSWLE
ncbi:MAG: homogentisate 1,2-dioxygenase [Deltaproteobacteria bacterium]|nr:homogentisate 1,2-dioxygenase [Deltaproteobacteria bacterium]